MRSCCRQFVACSASTASSSLARSSSSHRRYPSHLSSCTCRFPPPLMPKRPCPSCCSPIALASSGNSSWPLCTTLRPLVARSGMPALCQNSVREISTKASRGRSSLSRTRAMFTPMSARGSCSATCAWQGGMPCCMLMLPPSADSPIRRAASPWGTWQQPLEGRRCVRLRRRAECVRDDGARGTQAGRAGVHQLRRQVERRAAPALRLRRALQPL
mmetsp:Transcript_52047/g.134978  ORF Transcript_52047/g.134978 Transcript_52047/m.134978 type:complete len:215 (-) Transcript_52047:131-775(-)